MYDDPLDTWLACMSNPGTTYTDGSETRATADGFDIRHTWDTCGSGRFVGTFHVAPDGTVSQITKTMIASSTCTVGRRPAGLRASAALPARTRLGAFFADAARLEAASVVAFERLARELTQLAAPAELVATAARSALEEIRHTQLVSVLAQRFGGEPLEVSVAPLPERGLLEIALENAVEGCVRETYGALLAEHQAVTARDPEVRAVMAQVAQDELRHALLAWECAAFFEPKLTRRERAALRAAQAAAVAQLLREGVALTRDERALIGWPEPTIETALIERLAQQLQVGTTARRSMLEVAWHG
jgi:hypothetical protein